MKTRGAEKTNEANTWNRKTENTGNEERKKENGKIETSISKNEGEKYEHLKMKESKTA